MTGTIITKKGVQLLVKLLATKGNLNFSRVAIGTGSIPSGYDPASMIDLIEYKKDGVISRCEADNDVAKITMQVSSIGVETGFTMTEIGVFAEDPDLGEILYSYLDMREDPQYIYAEGGDAEKYVEITLEVAIEASTKVTAYINPDSLVTRAEFEEELLKVKNNFGTEDFDDSGEIEGIESFTDFMSSFVKGTSISEFLANLKAGLKFVLHAGHLVNNGMCETPGEFALDAAYGKTLTDQITQLYSDIQDLQNGLSALDTRVTNAINGGDLAAPFEMNFLITPYSNSITNVENSVTLDANTANKLQYTAYATYNNETGDYDAKVTRTYSTAVKIPDNKCILTFSGSCLVRSGYAEHIDNNLKVEVLNSAGSKLMETSAINSTANTTVQLSLASLKGQTVKLRVSMMSDGYPWRPRGFVISKLSISNKA